MNRKDEEKHQIAIFICSRGRTPQAKCQFELKGKLQGMKCSRPLGSKTNKYCAAHRRIMEKDNG